MIIGNIKQLADETLFLHEAIRTALTEMLSQHPENLPAGHYELSGENYFNVDEVCTEESGARRYESHKKYIDVQLLLEGEEWLAYKPLMEKGDLLAAYEDSDLYFWEFDTEEEFFIPMKKGQYVVLFPSDAHKPLVAPAEPEPVKKVILKIAVDSVVSP